jgi:hypothetical protein
MAANDGKGASNKSEHHLIVALEDSNSQTGNADFFQPVRRTPDKLFSVHLFLWFYITIYRGIVYLADCLSMPLSSEILSFVAWQTFSKFKYATVEVSG